MPDRRIDEPRHFGEIDVGSVMRDNTLSSVDFPEPLPPTMPSTSPRPSSKLTSRSAQIVGAVAPPEATLPRTPDAIDEAMPASRSLRWPPGYAPPRT